MGFKLLKSEFEQLRPAQLFTNPSGSLEHYQEAERTYRFWLLRLLFEIHGDLDSLAVSYRELLLLQQQGKQK
jgi:hypothetical protein